MSSAAMVSPRMRLSANATSSGIVLVEVVADHEHVEVLVERVDRERPRRVRRAREHVRLAADADDVRRVPAARALGVVGVDRAALERGDRVVDVARLVQRVGVDRDLHVVALGDAEAAVDRRGRRAPVLVQLEADRAGANLLDEPLGQRRVALAGEPEVDAAARRSPAASARCAARPACRSWRSCPSPGPVPPPTNVVTPLASASYACCGQMKWMCVSMPPAVTIRPSPAMASVVTPTIMPGVTPAITSGLPALPMPAMRPFLMPMSAL